MNEKLWKRLHERPLHTPSPSRSEHLRNLARERAELDRSKYSASNKGRTYLKRAIYASMGSAAAAVLAVVFLIQGANDSAITRIAKRSAGLQVQTKATVSSSYEDSLRQLDAGLSKFQVSFVSVYSNDSYSSGSLYRSKS